MTDEHVFVVFTEHDGGRSTIDIVGPFATETDAEALIERHPRNVDGVMHPIDGGYADAHVVSTTTATAPDAYLAEQAYIHQDDDDAIEVGGDDPVVRAVQALKERNYR